MGMKNLVVAMTLTVGLTLSACSDNGGSNSANAVGKKTDVSEFMKTGALEDNVLGNKEAKVTIVEYSSMTCPHCATFHSEILPAMKKQFIDTGKVNYIVREFPLDNLAAAAFMLARCAPKDKYFAFVDMLYAQQNNWAFGEVDSRKALFKLGKQVGFTQEKFDKCLENQKLLNGINWTRERGSKKFGVNSTPSFFINGNRFKGKMNEKEMLKALEDAVNKSSKSSG